MSTIDAASAAALSNKLQQLCNGAVYDDDHNVIPIHGCKVEAFQEAVEALDGEAAIVFYSYRHDLPRLEAAVAKEGRRARQLQTAADAAAWNAGEVDILFAHPASCAHGLNLQDGGRHIIWFGLTWSLELYQQANKRLHRQGQGRSVIIHNMVVAHGRDEDILQAIGRKEGAQDALINKPKGENTKSKGDNDMRPRAEQSPCTGCTRNKKVRRGKL